MFLCMLLHDTVVQVIQFLVRSRKMLTGQTRVLAVIKHVTLFTISSRWTGLEHRTPDQEVASSNSVNE